MESIKNSFEKVVSVMSQYDKENARSAMNLNSVVHLYNAAQAEPENVKLDKYRFIPETAINSIKTLISHNQRILDIIFSDKEVMTKEEAEKYFNDRQKKQAEFRKFLQELDK